MKAVTLTQPWATLVAIGAKKIETRSWNTNYRGPLAIHAAKGFPGWARRLCQEEHFRDRLGDYLERPTIKEAFPLGVVVATCQLVHVKQITELESFPACKAHYWKKHVFDLTDQERAFGDYSVGRYMWLLENIVALPSPILAKGKLGLWDWDEGKEYGGGVERKPRPKLLRGTQLKLFD